MPRSPIGRVTPSTGRRYRCSRKRTLEPACGLFRAIEGSRPHDVAPGVRVTLRAAGHILGSAIVEVRLADDVTVAFSGDLGRPCHPLLVPPGTTGAVDALVIESTYGNRVHDDTSALDGLAAVIERTARRGGTVVIPAFAVDRTEIVLFHLARLIADGRVAPLPVLVDSPMALASLAVYRRAVRERWADLRPELCADADDPFDTGTLEEVHDVDAIQGDRPDELSLDRRFGGWDGDRWSRPSPLGRPAPRPSQRDRPGRVPGRGHPRSPVGRGRTAHQGVRRVSPSSRRGGRAARPVGPRGC